MAKNVTRAVVYERDLNLADQQGGEKFAPLHALIADARRTNMAALMVKSPAALGDTYDELVANLDAIAAADLALMIVPPSHRGR